jgi:Protein of unknown function (DUF3995)
MVLLALGVAAVLLGLAVIHVYWAIGGRLGAGAAVPETAGRPAFTPSPNATLSVALGLTVAALVVLGRVQVWRSSLIPPAAFSAGTWVLAGVFLLRAVGDFRLVGFFKRVRGTRFATRDTFLYSPLCLALGLSLVGIARSAWQG